MVRRTCGFDDGHKGSYRLHQEALPGRADLERCTSSHGTVQVFDPLPIPRPSQVNLDDLTRPIFLVEAHLDLGEQTYS